MGIEGKHMVFILATFITLILISTNFHMINWKSPLVKKQTLLPSLSLPDISRELPKPKTTTTTTSTTPPPPPTTTSTRTTTTAATTTTTTATTTNLKLLPSASSQLDPVFAYLTQTEKCLPTHWMANDHLGNSSGCNCHIYVLSYKEPCFQNSSHMFYFHNKSLLWSGGRNLLFFAARKRSYLYYIFFDDDIKLIYNQYTPKPFIDMKIPPLKIFTDYLLDDVPAAAATAYNVQAPILAVRKKWRNVCKRNDDPRTYPFYHVDASFNAFHRDTAALLLPYYDKYDKKCAWLSQIFLLFKFQLMFYGRFDYFSFITTFNPAHRYNTKGFGAYLEDPGIRKDMVEAIREQTPPEYKNHSRFLSMMHYNHRRNYAGVLCIDPSKRRTPIIPYQNMKPGEIF